MQPNLDFRKEIFEITVGVVETVLLKPSALQLSALG